MKKNRLRTYPIKSLTIFLAITFVVSLAMVIIFIFLHDELMVIRVLVWILCGLFTVASFIVLMHQLFFYVAVDEEYFYRYYLFGHEKYALTKINKIINNEGFYDVYVKDQRVATFASDTRESQQIIMFLEQHKVSVDW